MPYKKRDDILAGKMTEASAQTTINNFSKQEITGENELVTITGTNGQLNINDANIYVSDNAGIVSNQQTENVSIESTIVGKCEWRTIYAYYRSCVT